MEVIQEQYKDTKIGRIPKDWEVKSIGEIAETSSGGTPLRTNSEYYENGTIPWVKTGELSNKYLFESDEHITEKAINKSSAKLFPKFSILVAMYGATIGKMSIIMKEMASNQACCALFPNDKIDYEYLYYGLRKRKENLISRGVGGAQPNISQKLIKVFELPIPPLPEQQKIAQILSTVDEQISTTQTIIDKSKELKKGLMQKLFSEGIGHTQFKDTKIGRIPKDWDVVKIMDISDNLDSKRIPIKSADRANMSGEYPYYGAQGIIDWVNQYIFDGDYLLVAEDGENVKSQKNDIAFLVGGKFWVNNHAHVLRCKGDYSQVFLSYYLNQLNIRKYVSGSAQPKLNKGTLMKIQVVAPSLSEQQKIADILTEADAKIEKEEQEKAQLEQLKKGLMQQLLTGQKRVA
jgi:type I restriction enzyme S subunit